MTSYENHAAVHNQAGVQNIHGNVIFNHAHHEASNDLVELDNKILSSLAFAEMLDRRSNIESAYHRTCEWIFDLDEYQTWRDAPCGLLWIKGKPGSGKSTLMSHLYDTLWRDRRIGNEVNLEFFFNARGTPLQRTSTGMFRSLLNQIFRQITDRKNVRNVYKDKIQAFGGSADWEWQPAELKRLFTDMFLTCAIQCKTTLFIDALDEAGEQVAIELASHFHDLMDLTTQQDGLARICISCRHYPIVAVTKATEIYVERHNLDDIVTYIEGKIQRFSGLTSDDEHGDNLVKMLVRMANGVFQWACLVTPMVLKWLNAGDSVEEIRTRLSEVPKDLGAVYEHILEKIIDRRYRMKALRLFQWVCLAEESLSTRELRFALSAENITVTTGCADTTGFIQADKIMNRHVETWSGGLLEVVPRATPNDPNLATATFIRTYIVQVIHQSVNDFLLTRGLLLLMSTKEFTDQNQEANRTIRTSGEAVQVSHALLYSSCLKYLAFELPNKDFAKGSTDSPGTFPLSERVPFLRYSQQYCLFHAEKSGMHRNIDLKIESQMLTRCLDIWSIDDNLELSMTENADTVLHVASKHNLLDLVQHCVECGHDVNEGNNCGWTALHFAARRGHLAIVETLYEAGIDVYTETSKHQTSLYMAAYGGHTEVVAYLFSTGTKFNMTSTSSLNAFYWAVHDSNLTMCKLFVDAGFDVKHVQLLEGLVTALSKNQRLLQWFISVGLDANMKGGEQGNILKATVMEGNFEMVQLLLGAGADVNAQGTHPGPAIRVAVSKRGMTGVKMVKLLIKAGADVNAQGGMYGSALWAAVVKGDVEVIRSLIGAGANVNARGKEYVSIMQAAIFGGNPEIVQMLLEAGADVNMVGGMYGSSLQAAVSGRYLDVVQMLVEIGADVHHAGQYCDLLRTAIESESVDMVRTLIEAGGGINCQMRGYDSVLKSVVEANHPTITRMLLEASTADFNLDNR